MLDFITKPYIQWTIYDSMCCYACIGIICIIFISILWLIYKVENYMRWKGKR